MRTTSETTPRNLTAAIDRIVRIPYKKVNHFQSLGVALWEEYNWNYMLVDIDGRDCLHLENENLSSDKINLITSQFFDLLGPDWTNNGISAFIKAIENDDDEMRQLQWIFSERYFSNLPFGAFMEPEHVNSISIDEQFGRFSILIEPLNNFVEFIDDIIAQRKLEIALGS